MTNREASIAMGETELAPGVWGYTVENEQGLWVPIINAENPGSGDVSRYLDGLPKDRPVHFPCVISERLAGMLLRRGFVGEPLEDDDLHMVRLPTCIEGSRNDL